jgi:hypothetical protein
VAAVRRCSVTHQYTVNFAPLLADMSAEMGCCTLWDGEIELSCREAQIDRPRLLLFCHARRHWLLKGRDRYIGAKPPPVRRDQLYRGPPLYNAVPHLRILIDHFMSEASV